MEVTLSTGEKVTLLAEFDPGQHVAGATFYATVDVLLAVLDVNAGTLTPLDEDVNSVKTADNIPEYLMQGFFALRARFLEMDLHASDATLNGDTSLDNPFNKTMRAFSRACLSTFPGSRDSRFSGEQMHRLVRQAILETEIPGRDVEARDQNFTALNTSIESGENCEKNAKKGNETI